MKCSEIKAQTDAAVVKQNNQIRTRNGQEAVR